MIDLKKLYLNSLYGDCTSSLIVEPEPDQAFSSTLVRLDLHAIFLDSWVPDIPSLTTLTLSHVEFGIDSDTDDDLFITARQFFQSFPKLQAIAFDGLESINSDALAFLPIFSLRHLYLGKCSYSESKCSYGPISSGTDPVEFVDCLARHFRPKIQHLVLDPVESSSVRLAELLSSRKDRSFPPYLAKLKSIRIATPAPNESEKYCPEATISEDEEELGVQTSVGSRGRGKADEEKRVKTMLDEAGLKGVEIRWWRQGEMEACTAWDPDEARYH